MVAVYYCRLGNLPDPLERQDEYHALPPERLKRALAFSLPHRRIECAGSGLLLCRALARYGVRAEEVTVGEHGKPQHGEICFNLAHSGDLAVVAVSASPVGCDVERVRPIGETVLSRFSAREREYIQKRGGCAFFDVWTRRESYLKYTGEGVSRLGEIEADMERNAIVRNGKTEACHLFGYELDGYMISVCSEEESATPLREIDV